MTAKVLRRAAELVEQGWTSGHSARDEQGQPCFYYDPRAVRWCMDGAVRLAAKTLGANAYSSLRALWRTLGGLHAPWNDTPGRTADEVADVLRQAAEHAEVADA
jgi:hypothetical protein